jgi:hypothetical protein
VVILMFFLLAVEGEVVTADRLATTVVAVEADKYCNQQSI